MQSISHCPVCGKIKKFKEICSGCGYDPARDYEMYSTLVPIPSSTASVSAKRLEQLQKEKQTHTVDEKPGKKSNKTIAIGITVIVAIMAFVLLLTSILKSGKSRKVGASFKFGSYEQDNDTSNGKEEIEWVILDKNGKSLLLISKYALDCQPYNKGLTDVTWETCTLRKWLNSTFLSTAFTEEEREMIPEITVSADSNPNYDTDQGNSTTDRVFLLSVQEVQKYFSTDTERMCAPTAYAIKQGAGTSRSYKQDGRATGLWFLRSVGDSGSHASCVSIGGHVIAHGLGVDFNDVGVRPALWVNLESEIR